MAASQGYLKWGLCPQTPGIFIEGIETEGKCLLQNRTFLNCPKPNISKLLRHINTLLIDLAKEPQEENTIPSCIVL